MFHERILKGEQTYIAGMWSGILIPSLLWRVKDGSRWDDSPCERPESPKSIAPSWSWASICGKLQFETDTGVIPNSAEGAEAVVQLIDFYMDLEHPDNPYDPIKDGFLLLSGLLRPAGDFYWLPYISSGQGADRNYNARAAVLSFSSLFINVTFDDIRDYDQRKKSTLVPGSYTLNDTFFLPVLITKDFQLNFATDEQRPAVEGLILASVGAAQQPGQEEYVRIGYFRTRKDDNAERMIATFRESPPSNFLLR